jgi:hypothetical protein
MNDDVRQPQNEFYLFVDERYESCDSDKTAKRWIMGCVIVGKQRWEKFYNGRSAVGHGQKRTLRIPGKKQRLNWLVHLLADLQAFAFLTYADLPIALVEPGKTCCTDDIPEMAFTDLTWSLEMTALLMTVFAYLHNYTMGQPIVDLFYDNKDLKEEHRTAVEHFLKRKVRELTSCHFRTIERISHRDPNSAFNAGTLVAHYLCEQAKRLYSGPAVSRIVIHNQTMEVLDLLEPWTKEATKRLP